MFNFHFSVITIWKQPHGTFTVIPTHDFSLKHLFGLAGKFYAFLYTAKQVAPGWRCFEINANISIKIQSRYNDFHVYIVFMLAFAQHIAAQTGDVIEFWRNVR